MLNKPRMHESEELLAGVGPKERKWGRTPPASKKVLATGATILITLKGKIDEKTKGSKKTTRLYRHKRKW